MERRSPWRNEINHSAIEMLYAMRCRRHRKLRRLGNEGICREINAGADRAIIVIRIAGLRGKRCRDLRSRAEGRNSGVGAANAVEMDVPKGDDELQRQRCKRQQACLFTRSEPTHGRL